MFRFPAAKGTASSIQPSDGLILVSGLGLEGHSVIFLAIRTHLSCRFLLAVDFSGLRRSGSSSQIINQPQDYFKQASRNSHFGQLEGDVAAMSDNLGTDLISFSGSVVNDQCPTFFGNARVRFWLLADIHPHSDLRPLCPRKQTFGREPQNVC